MVIRAYCKLQKLLPLAKLISKYASWHLMPGVKEVRAKAPAGDLNRNQYISEPVHTSTHSGRDTTEQGRVLLTSN